MKKILSLVLALVMLSSLALSASAGSVYSLSDLLDFYRDYLNHDDPDYEDLVDYLAGNTGNWWYDSCPKCGGLAFYKISGGSVKYACLEKDCDAEGTTVIIPENKDEADSVVGTDVAVSTKCSSCTRTAYYSGSYVKNDKLYYEYTCTAKHVTLDEVYDYSEDRAPDLSDITCSRCGRVSEFDYFTVIDSDIYGVFLCPKDHKTYKLLRDDVYEDDDDEYRVKVIITGEGDYQISDSHYGEYGDYKYIKFSPAKGYELSKVLVNGRNVNFTSDEIAVRLTGDTTVRVTFTPVVKNYTVTAAASGNGTVKATYNGKTVDAAKIGVVSGDKITYKFVPASDNYYVSSLKVNGKSVTPSTSYTLSKIGADTKIEVKFAWKNPFTDVSDKYAKAVEYVTESGIMSAAAKDGKNLLFKGTAAISEKAFAAALAEMADTGDKLNTVAQRIVWAEKYGIVEKDADLSGVCDVQTAVEMVNQYLMVLEVINDINFDNFDAENDELANAVAIDLVTVKTYEKNRDLCRYDLAAICRMVATLDYTD